MSRVSFRFVFLVMCAVAALLPIAHSTAKKTATSFPGWPTEWEGQPIVPLALSDAERKWNSDFPGEIAKFTNGKGELLFRWITQGTRRLHPGSDCFRGLGYAIKPLPAILDLKGARWSCFSATRGREHLCVRERITDERGREWSDVSDWYWSVLLRKTNGPWLAVTVVEAI